jgi:phosphohistidine phosphatase SixA
MTRALLLLAAVLLLAGCGAGDGERDAARPDGPAALVEALRGGGYVLYLRHAETDLTERDYLGAPMHDCERQRNLNEAGREQARAIGEAVRALGIPTGQVVSSEYCRCLETARLAFDRVVPEPLLTGLPGPGEADYEERTAALRRLLGEPPAAGSNRVVVGHGKNLEAVTDVSPDEGESAVFEPLGGSDFRLSGRIPAAVWPQLAEALAEG